VVIQDEAESWNDMIIANFRAHDGHVTIPPFVGASLLLLTTTGARTGLPRTAPLGYTRDGNRFVVIGSNSGGPTNPEWLYNVIAHPLVTLEVTGETFQAGATVPKGAERQRLFDAMAAKIPAFADYQGKTTRQLPVVTFERQA
jgi:deazaflavin-dependent oxidoreductase (nitroreductase family)